MAAASAKTMWFGDTGAGMHCVTHSSLAVKGSLRPNSALIVTANGTTTPKYRCREWSVGRAQAFWPGHG
eukprot:1100186-Pleurochrysis_carterae.AAC.1